MLSSWRAQSLQLASRFPFLLQLANLGAPDLLSPVPLRSVPSQPVMADTGIPSNSPEIHQVDIDDILDQDDQDFRDAKKSHASAFEGDQLDRHDEDESESDNVTSEEDSEEAVAEEEARNFYNTIDGEDRADEARPPSPAPSPNPYAHPPITDIELDFDWEEEENIREALKAKRRKKAGKLACVGLSSTASKAEIEWCLRYYDKGCIWARPHPWMRPHVFDYNPRLRIPRMVLTPKLVKLGIGPPLHPYFRSIIEWYDIAPIQLSPNSWKLAIALYMLYRDHNNRAPTMEDLSFFFRLGASSCGYYYLVIWKTHNSTGWSEGKTSHDKKWKEPFFYTWPDERIRTQFNVTPSKSSTTSSRRALSEIFPNSCCL